MADRDPSWPHRLLKLRAEYKGHFREMGELSRSEALEHHLYHLALYWSRVMAMVRLDIKGADGLVISNLGACILVASDSITKDLRIGLDQETAWAGYRSRLDALFFPPPPSFEDLSAASKAYDDFLDQLGYVTWQDWQPTPGHPTDRLPRKP